MSEFKAICKLDDIAPGEVQMFKVTGKELALARISTGEVYAFGRRCTHLRAALERGTLSGAVLTCPLHHSQFDVTSGKVVRWVQKPPLLRVISGLMPRFLRRSLPTYEVQVQGADVQVKV